MSPIDRRAWRDRLIHALLLAVFGGAALPSALAQQGVPAQFRGRWVPVDAACQSRLHMLVAANKIALVHDKDSVTLGGIEMAGPGYFPPDYHGIQTVLLTEFSGDQPAIVTFNANEKKGIAQIEYAPVQPGASTAQGKAYNAHIARLNLAKRVPLDKKQLRRCEQ